MKKKKIEIFLQDLLIVSPIRVPRVMKISSVIIHINLHNMIQTYIRIEIKFETIKNLIRNDKIEKEGKN